VRSDGLVNAYALVVVCVVDRNWHCEPEYVVGAVYDRDVPEVASSQGGVSIGGLVAACSERTHYS